MQITEDTARHLGLSNLMDPRRTSSPPRAIFATLKAKLPARIQEPDRTWLALAAFNIGSAISRTRGSSPSSRSSIPTCGAT
jgi:membrane-bound lytic murein transglycosylase F